MMALRFARQPALVISDHLSLVKAGNDWGPHNESARSRHASVWKAMHLATGSCDAPNFKWVPAHRDAAAVLDSQDVFF